jgi:hypothetical protein
VKVRTCSSILVTTLLLTQAPFALAATTWYVNGVNGSDGHNCKSPLTPCKTIGHAISLAASGDAITVAAATYHEHLTIPDSLTITGTGAADTIIDPASYLSPGRVVTIPNTGINVTLTNLTLENGWGGNRGGGVYNQGTLTINNSVITGNYASDVCFPPNLCVVGYGGGVYNTGTLTINRTTINANVAHGFADAAGAGIYNLGKLTINASTLSGNEVNGGAAVPCALCEVGGGGIYNKGTLSVHNSTVTGNYSRIFFSSVRPVGGGIVGSGRFFTSIVSIYSSTVSANAGGIVGAATLQNSIVANNGSGGNCNGPVTSIFSLSSDGTCHLTGPGDRNNTNPRLGTLGKYGGPTQTIPLLSGSPAIDAGNPSGCTDGLGHLLKTDQRGLPRPNSEDKSGCDNGGFRKAGRLEQCCLHREALPLDGVTISPLDAAWSLRPETG